MSMGSITLEELGRAFASMLQHQGDVVVNSRSAVDDAMFFENDIFTLKISAVTLRPSHDIQPVAIKDIERQFGAHKFPLPSHMFAGAWLRFDSPCSQEVVNESARVLVPGGIMAIVSPAHIEASLLIRQVKTSTGVPLKQIGEAQLAEAPGTCALLFQQVGSAAGPPDMSTQCEFCFPWRFVANKRAQLPGAAAILWGDEDFLVMPDVAPVRLGHLLFLPTRHQAAMGAIQHHLVSRLEYHVGLINAVMQASFGRRAIFIEHGAVRSHAAGSCIDHAHWHCLPDDGDDVIAQLARRGIQGAPGQFSDIRMKCERGESYFLVRKDNEHWTFPSSGLPCQFMRLLTAKADSPHTLRWQTALGSRSNALMYDRTLAAVLPVVDAVLAETSTVTRGSAEAVNCVGQPQQP